MALVKLDTGFNIEVDFAISPFHKRLFAWAIDIVIAWVYIQIMNALIDDYSYWITLAVSAPVVFYHLIMEVSFNGKSLGKMALNIKVITAEGGQPSVGQYLLRWLFRMLDFPIFILALLVYQQIPWWTFPLLFCGLFCVILTPMSQRIGDLVAGTIIIDLRNRTSWQDTVFKEVESNYQPRYPQVMQLSDRDINTLKSIIENVKKKGDYDLSMRIAERIKSKLKMNSDQDSLEFLETLLKDYNYYSTN
ncbi:MAG: RDD family protein [Chitinophagaceae bacterium]|nr:RDD family protein [Chitinophagaceae bacterium]